MLEIGKIDQRFWDLLKKVPDEIKKIDGIYDIDPFTLADDYVSTKNVADISIDPNANVSGKSPVNMDSEVYKPQKKLRNYYLIWDRLKLKYGIDEANKIMLFIFNSPLYFHDITKVEVPYCFAPDTSFWMQNGRPYGWLPGSAPNKARSFIGQTTEVAMDFSQENAGAIGLANFLVNVAYYTGEDKKQLKKTANILQGIYDETSALWEKDLVELLAGLYSHNDDNYEKVKVTVQSMLNEHKSIYEILVALYGKDIQDSLQQFVHVMHNTFRIGGDSPFTNISLFCSNTIRQAFKDAVYPDFSKPVDNIDEIMWVQYLYADFFAKGSPITGKNYRFPVTTVNFHTRPLTEAEKAEYPHKKCFITDEDFFKRITKLNAKRGAFNIHKGEKIASCCRLTSDLAELKNQIKMDSFGNGGMSIGSHRVVTMDLLGLAMIAVKENRDLDAVINEYQGYAEKLLIVHKEILAEIVKSGILKFFNIGWVNLNMFFSTFGFIGLYDSYKVLKKFGKEDRDYLTYAKEVLGTLEDNAKDAGKRNRGFAFNVEEIPGENAAVKMAQKDNYLYYKFPNYERVELLSNQMIPLFEHDFSMGERLDIMGELMNINSGGAICHLNIDGSMTDEVSEDLTRAMIEDYDITHFAMCIGTSTCTKGHTHVGIHKQCPECQSPIKTWTTRVVGFNTDTEDWASVRREWELPRRKWYKAGEPAI